MSAIWFLSKNRNLLITSFNKVVREDVAELWVTEMNGNSRKIAEGPKAHELESALLDMIWDNFPAIITDGNNKFASNINTNVEEEVE